VSAESDPHVVLGASGAIGGAVVRELASQGHRVRAVSRGGGGPEVPGVKIHRGDITSAGGAKAACEGAHVVYHCATPAYHRGCGSSPR